MVLTWDVIGAPSSAGAHTPGVERAPAALREAGLVELLRRAAEAADVGDVRPFRWRPDPARPNGQNAGEVLRVATDVAQRVEASVRRGRKPLLLGGDCTVTMGLVAGHERAGLPVALVYVDGGPDLYTPLTRANGNLDAMGLAHLLGLPGTLPDLAAVGGVVPLLTPERVVVYGDSLPPGDHEYDLVAELGIDYVPASEVHADPTAAASRARAAAEAAASAFVVHFDVDVLNFVDAPLADVPEPAGLTLDEASTTLATLVASPRFAGLSVTEINPDHLPDTELLPRFARILAGALSGGDRRAVRSREQ
ncbi:arginase [Micromonospora phaseoli]|uniref:Arginase n=1 Tax=Micromonospora phaseoli TaxID=1144548 RepID=A0A1H7DSY5_9ACTN|nr:arginase family protein [Micromonospora phaseoli]PZV99191.1 arginase [Micromonospora phaseoli]GIJ80013.1 arginase [Micromonospora phaseoli]SEK04843.1 arginase [Micromonospora phaseoli]